MVTFLLLFKKYFRGGFVPRGTLHLKRRDVDSCNDSLSSLTSFLNFLSFQGLFFFYHKLSLTLSFQPSVVPSVGSTVSSFIYIIYPLHPFYDREVQ